MKIAPLPATLTLGLGTLVSHGFGLSLVPAMLPRIEDEFRSGYGMLGIAVATGLLAYAIGSLLSSILMRKIPTRALLVATYALTGIGFIVSATAPSPAFIAVAVVLLGVSAPISWTATIQVARESVDLRSLALVSAGASGGAAAGVIVNGVLVQTSASLHSWRTSFLIAALVAGAVMILTLTVFPLPVPGPVTSGTPWLGIWAQVLRDRAGRTIVATSAVSGVAVFTLFTFLTATAIDELEVSSTAAAALLWIAGIVGVFAAIAFGRLGDRQTPTRAMALAMTTYSACLVVVSLGWSYPTLLVAVVGYGVLNGPVWGLMGAAAGRRFSAELSVGAVSAGLVAASLLGAVGNSLAGTWIESRGSMRQPVLVLALLTAVSSMYLVSQVRADQVDRAARGAT